SFTRLVNHRAFDVLAGTLEDTLIKWTKVPPGFFEMYRPLTDISTDELASKMSITVEQLLDENSRRICAIMAGDKGPRVQAYLVKAKVDITRLYRMHTVVLTESVDPFSRLPADLIKPLQAKKVAIVGLGSGGSEIALNLACAGVGHLVLFDDDRLSMENYIRHVLHGRDLGRNKINGIVDDLRARNLK